MSCEHCCYSCDMNGEHMSYDTVIDAIMFCRNQDNEYITIGGGEPTLHPRFFDIIRYCLNDFNYVWMATNGSQTKIMNRLANILDNCDYDDIDDNVDIDNELQYINNNKNNLTVCLSQDRYHDEIDEKIVTKWERMSNKHMHTGYEIRDVFRFNDEKNIALVGRAEENGIGQSTNCCCEDFIVQIDGKIRMCGCPEAPIVGDIWNGFDDEWEDRMFKNDNFQDVRCYKSLNKEIEND